VKISLDFDQKEMKFSISDTGIGIPESEQENVFKRFFRASNALKFETEGNGIGLYLAKNIVEAHGGKIWFESKENKGTTFYFTLPLK
jgi:two-component system sensor histidine kinase VicK